MRAATDIIPESTAQISPTLLILHIFHRMERQPGLIPPPDYMERLWASVSHRRHVYNKPTPTSTKTFVCRVNADSLRRPCDSLEVARRADVRLGQPLPLPLSLLLPLGEGGVHDVVHLRVVMVTLNTVDLRVFDVDGRHGQRRTWRSDGDDAEVTVSINTD